jgi:hypothetical protein
MDGGVSVSANLVTAAFLTARAPWKKTTALKM